MSTDLEVAKSTQLANVDALLQEKAAKLLNNIHVGGSAISLKDKQFNLPNGEVVDGPLDLVVVDYRFWNKRYEKPWNPKNPEAPVCFACSEDDKDMQPSDNSPKKQAEDCSVCPLNQFGTNGEAKACRNTMTLGVMYPGQESDEVMSLSASPTAFKKVAAQLKKATSTFGHPIKAVMTFEVVTAGRGFNLKVSNIDRNEDYAYHAQFLQQAEDVVTAEPQPAPVDDEVEAAPQGNAAPRRRSRAA